MAAEQCFDEAANYRLASALAGIPAADPGQYDAITVVHALQGLAHGECRDLVEQIAAAAQPMRIAKRVHCSALAQGTTSGRCGPGNHDTGAADRAGATARAA